MNVVVLSTQYLDLKISSTFSEPLAGERKKSRSALVDPPKILDKYILRGQLGNSKDIVPVARTIKLDTMY